MTSQLSVMLLVFIVALAPGLASRRMERGDMLTLVAIPIAMFPVAVLPGIIIWGLTKDSGTYLLGMAIVVIVAVLNYRFPPKRHVAEQHDRVDAGSAADPTTRES